HHLALNWNLGEEINNASTAQKKAWAEYFWTHDPYHHHIVIHNGANHYDLLGPGSKLTGFSLQTGRPDFRQVHSRTLNYITRSAKAGKQWVVACDEPGDASHALRPDDDAGSSHEDARVNALWGNLLAGGAGNEWYFGYRHDHSDLTCQDWRSRDRWWDTCRIAVGFFREHVPFWKMASADKLVAGADAWCLAQPGQVYAVLLRKGGTAILDLGDADATFTVQWFNPRAGGKLQSGTVRTITGPGKQSLGAPPADRNKDWVALVKRTP
ncbi:MAG: putative collagen-binding domain-containing protein, partial [Planctomycetota bacterium]